MPSSAYMVTCPKGVEHLLANELRILNVDSVQESVAACYFHSSQDVAYKVCLCSRIANRVIDLKSRVHVNSVESFYEIIRNLDWESFFSSNSSILVDFNGSSSYIRDSRFGAQLTKDGINDRFIKSGKPRISVNLINPDILVYVRLFNNKLSIGLDLVGESLHKRGYRKYSGEAPLKENLAAGILIQNDWKKISLSGGAFLDPMCGSATFLIEAALIAADIPPTFLKIKELLDNNSWCLTKFANYDNDVWNNILCEQNELAEKGFSHNIPPIVGFDVSQDAVNISLQNIAYAGLQNFISVKKEGVAESSFQSTSNHGLMVVNPPYGKRLGEEEDLILLYRELGRFMINNCMDWSACIFTGNIQLGWHTGLRSWRQHNWSNGGINCQLQRYVINQNNFSEFLNDDKKVFGLEDLNVNALMLANRLKKNLRKLKNWRKINKNISFRLYNADLPEYAVAIDCYVSQGFYDKTIKRFVNKDDLYINLQEYAPPKTIDSQAAKRRLKDAIVACSAVLECPIGKIFLKQRERKRGAQQYQKNKTLVPDILIEEGGHRFIINLQKYIDTGLFLDHRKVRLEVASYVKNKTFLNLYAYTCSATVYAAIAGSKSSVSVDLSSNYLDWGSENFKLNEVDTSIHKLVKADCFKWLESTNELFDCILLDPPSFSNSKSMNKSLDILRDHSVLIDLSMLRLAQNGRLYFSSNKRDFKLSEDILEKYQVCEITRKTIDIDFSKGKQAHRSWQIEFKTN